MTQQITQQIDGIDLYIEGAGPETIVMIHGWPDTYRLWDAQVAALKANYRCVRFTLPGFDNTKARRAYSLAETVQIIQNIVQQVSPEKNVVLMLHDWGCVFGYQFYMRHPTLVSKIIGVDIGNVDAQEYKSSLSIVTKLMVFYYQIWLAIAWRMGSRIGDPMTRLMARAMKCTSDPQYISSGMNYPYYIQWTGTYDSYRDALPFEAACPLMFIYGTKKPFMFHSQQWLDALGKKPTSRVLALATDHWPMVGQAAVFNQTVQSWLRESAA
jgi:pimeloyl-ACP methyl ester carboxylesterase